MAGFPNYACGGNDIWLLLYFLDNFHDNISVEVFKWLRYFVNILHQSFVIAVLTTLLHFTYFRQLLIDSDNDSKRKCVIILEKYEININRFYSVALVLQSLNLNKNII